MRLGLLACLWLAACAPEPTASPPSEPVLVEGGVVEGRFVRAAGLQLALPSPTPHVARNGETLLAAYPYQLLVYRNGFIQDSLPLPGVPTFVRARPLPLVGLDDRLFVPGQGSRLYKARDALHTPEGVYWLDEQGVSLERRRLAEGRYSFLAAGERYVYALGPEALRLPDRLRFPLPAGVKAAVVLEDLYVLTPQGLFRLSPEGLRLGFRAGVFSGLQSDGVYLYTLEAGRLLTLRLNLDPASHTLFPAWASHPDPSALHLEVP
ncbi:MAG: hypothetical protein NZN28_06360 [Meiothermus sp.]|uniref:hypothetical protein n=1 Tax=Meiothermus sp. TaxID=1955249 RepID=UPI0025D9C948|nr:hypothetical protein [Meiothermus sp.]MCS7068238.1 hypothetical protein [Meiothermus sp.]